jgi:hypothetical protein
MENADDQKGCLGGNAFFAIIEQNALNYSVVFARRGFFLERSSSDFLLPTTPLFLGRRFGLALRAIDVKKTIKRS